MERYFAIGDIHGCYDELVFLLNKLPRLCESDEIIFLGDYIDRGPDSRKVVQYLMELRLPCKTVFLKGNHEDMLLRNDIDIWLYNGGTKTLDSYGARNVTHIPTDHIAFLNSTINYYETNDYIFVHAGINPYVTMEEQIPNDLMWVREAFIKSDADIGKRVIFGHTIQRNGPLVMGNKIGIDTGCFYTGILTCIELPRMIFYNTEK